MADVEDTGSSAVEPTLPTFVAQLGAALSEMGEPVSSVQDRLTAVARAYGAPGARVSAFPTYFMISMGTGEPVVLELTTSFGGSFRLDQFSAVDRLVGDATRGTIDPADGLDAARRDPHFGRPGSRRWSGSSATAS